MIDLFVVLWLIAVSGGLGLLLIPDAAWRESRLLHLSAAVAVGLGVLMLVTLGLGAAGVLLSVGRYGVPPVMTVIAAFGVVRWLRNPAYGRTFPSEKFTLFDWALIILSGLLVLKNLLASFTPEVRFDAINYHIAFPHLYVSTGGIEDYSWNVMFHLPQNIEMLYTLVLLWGSDSGPKLLHCFLGLGTLAVIYGLGERFFSRRAGLIGVFLFYVQPQTAMISNTAFNDLGRAFFEILALGCLMEFWRERGRKTAGLEEEDRTWVYLAAVFAGLSLGIKWTSFPVFFAPLFLVHGWYVFRLGFRRDLLWTGVLLFFIPLFMFTPWMIKDLVFTGNPIYPFLNHLFGLSDQVSVEAERFMNSQAPQSSAYSWAGVLPYWLARLIYIGHAGSVIVWIYCPSVVVFALIRWIESRRRKGSLGLAQVFSGFPSEPRAENILLIYTILSFVGFLFLTSNADGRFLLPTYPACALLLGHLWVKTERFLLSDSGKGNLVSPGLLSTVKGIVIAALLANTFRHQYLSHRDLREPWYPVSNRETHLQRNPLLPGLEKLPKGSYVLGTVLPARVKCLPRVYVGRDTVREKTGPPPYSAETLYLALRELGITHFTDPNIYPLDRTAFEGLKDKYGRRVFSAGDAALYALSPPGESTDRGSE